MMDMLIREDNLRNERRISEGRSLPKSEVGRSACPVRDSASSVGDMASKTSVSNGACHPSFTARGRRGQQVIEYALVLVGISAALMMMYVYSKRGLQSTIKDLTDYEIGSQQDSVPILATESHQSVNATVRSLSSDRIEVKKDPDFGAQYDYNTRSTTQGESTAVFNEF